MSAPASPARRRGAAAASLARIAAMVRRYLYLLRSSWPRLAELMYWPAIQLVTWGFVQVYVDRNAALFGGQAARLGGIFIGAVLLWDILFRGQLGFSISFLEEMWARNLGNLMMSPLRPAEFVVALMVMSMARLAIGIVPVSIAAILFFDFNLYAMGFALLAFFVNLILTSWAVGLFVSGLVLRHGLGAESFAWTLMFLLLPLTCVYYPLSVLPGWLQYVALALPPTYVFEGMRAVLIENRFEPGMMLRALALNALYFSVAALAFGFLLREARKAGSLVQSGE